MECRHRTAREDVQWIEELYGRKGSLGAASVVAVSSSGFTRGAIAKAARLGVFLRTLSQVIEEDVLAWGTRTAVCIVFVQLRSLHLAIVTSDRIDIPTPLGALRTDEGAAFPLDDVVSGVSQRLHASGAPEGVATVEIKLKRIFLGMTPIHEALLSFEWQRVERNVALPVLLAYERVGPEGKSVDALVEKSHHNHTEIQQATSGGFAMIDVSALPFEQCCTLVGARFAFDKPMSLRGVGIIGPTVRTELVPLQVSSIRRDDLRYRQLMKSARDGIYFPDGP